MLNRLGAAPGAVHAAAVRFRNATVGYDRHPAVHHVDGDIEPGSLVAVIGPNGAGKSTLLKAVAGLIQPIDGEVRVEGCPRRRIAYLPQQSEIDRSFPIPVFDFVAMGLWRTVGLFGAFRRPSDVRVAEALGAVGLAGFERRTLDTLSGGQMQRVLFARLMLQDSPLILLDEPFTALDDSTAEALLDLVLRWQAEGRTVLTVLHDLGQVRAAFPTVMLIARRVVAFGPTDTVLTPAALRTARQMTEAWDDDAPVCRHDGPDHRHAAPGHGHAAHRHEAAP
ncbi:zinc ABC transporter ATP-binding protein AztA [Mongoliimonas terrestris]|uniref:zinc ABC transporter ATP-binding protein AztA n=1 Tax=Mongoliimonas terrestris TaxID=1709001 RepID=UPI00094965CD|nr:zinc ABC transporter ATP-binding protein AztA [Mongoliimonas terrestris]